MATVSPLGRAGLRAGYQPSVRHTSLESFRVRLQMPLADDLAQLMAFLDTL